MNNIHDACSICLVNILLKNGFQVCKFYDIDMLYPSDEDVEKYFRQNQADIVGLSAVVSGSYIVIIYYIFFFKFLS